MRLTQGLDHYPRPATPVILLLGNFDGLHRGHQSLINYAVERAATLGGHTVAMIFRPHPLQILRPAYVPRFLVNDEQRVELLTRFKIDELIYEPFDHTFAQLTPRAFVELIYARLHMTEVVVGFNYSFGHKGAGNYQTLADLGQELGFQVTVMPPFLWEGETVSSSRVRQVLGEGDITSARRLLGYYPQSAGEVISGERRGRTLGFPTANLGIKPCFVIPAQGVYAASVSLDKPYKAVVNIGSKPTFHEQYPISVEVHLADFDGDLYGQTLRVNFLKKIRDEIKFSGIDELVRQITRDKDEALRICSEIIDLEALLS
jgi:riboflavin kinase/FMN adenylyltransferase